MKKTDPLNADWSDAMMDDVMTGPFQDPLYVVALRVLEALSQLELYFKDPRYMELVTFLGPYLEMYAASSIAGVLFCLYRDLMTF